MVLASKGVDMKELVAKLKNDFTPYGYQKSRNSFWKIENGFYRLIDFQKGAYGDYLFINVCLYPAGLPSLIAGKLEIKERPWEYECIIRQRKFPSLSWRLSFADCRTFLPPRGCWKNWKYSLLMTDKDPLG